MPRVYGNDYAVLVKDLTVTQARKKIKFSFSTVCFNGQPTDIYLGIFDSTGTLIRQVGDDLANNGVYHRTDQGHTDNAIDFMTVERLDGLNYTVDEVLTIKIQSTNYPVHYYQWFLFELID